MKVAEVLRDNTSTACSEHALETYKLLCWRSGCRYHSRKEICKWNEDWGGVAWITDILSLNQDNFTATLAELKTSVVAAVS